MHSADKDVSARRCLKKGKGKITTQTGWAGERGRYDQGTMPLTIREVLLHPAESDRKPSVQQPSKNHQIFSLLENNPEENIS